MRLFSTVAIVGTGLIGGSLALAIRKHSLAKNVIGISRRASTLAFALREGVVTSAARDFSALKDADLIVLATPVHTILAQAPVIARIVKEGCMVIDVGSTKEVIVRRLTPLFDAYCGTHPLAGAEKSGIRYATADLFKDTLCVLTPTHSTSPRVLSSLKRLWHGVGARTVSMSSSRHDRIVSFVSHLPHAAAFALMACIPSRYLRYAAGGLRDTTRIAASDPILWEEILLSNAGNMNCVLSVFERHLCRLRDALKKGDRPALHRLLVASQRKRLSLT